MDIKTYLEKKGISWAELAKIAGVSRTTMFNILRGKDIYLSIAIKVEEATKGKVKCQDLLPSKSKQSRPPKQKEAKK